MSQAVRWILGVHAAIGGAFVLVVGIGAWKSRPVPYILEDGMDLRAALRGSWDWSNRAKPCADSTHAITFSPDGKVMEIVQAWEDSTTGDWYRTVYDIVGESPGTITGAIRGEDRLTDSGVPVVWDLILVGPNAYTWRRTDWGARSSTARIVRCDGDRIVGIERG